MNQKTINNEEIAELNQDIIEYLKTLKGRLDVISAYRRQLDEAQKKSFVKQNQYVRKLIENAYIECQTEIADELGFFTFLPEYRC